jgi:hypothetical protein
LLDPSTALPDFEVTVCAKLPGIPGPIARYLGFQRSVHNFERVVLEPSLKKGQHCRLKRVAYLCSFVLQKWGFILPRMRRGIAEDQLLGYPHVSDVWIFFRTIPSYCVRKSFEQYPLSYQLVR